jgi:anthranilate synthase component 1
MQLNQFPSRSQFYDLARLHNVIPVGLEVLADTETPVSLLGKLYYRNKALFLLESVEGGERWGRYSFLGTSASWDIQVFADTVEVRHQGQIESIDHKADPLGVLRSFMNRFKPVQPEHLPRFWGGLVGYFSYESVCFFEKIPHSHPTDRPLAHFVIPDELLIFDNVKNTLTLVAIAFVNDPLLAKTAYFGALERIDSLQRLLQAPLPTEKPMPSERPIVLSSSVSREGFRRRVLKTKQYIHDGDIIQAVISQPFESDVIPDLWMLYRAQRYINPSPYMFFLNLGKTALVGSSPETMVRLENRIATVRPIAGTRPRGNSEQSDRRMADELLRDEKERAEHLMLVDLGRNDLGRVAEVGSRSGDRPDGSGALLTRHAPGLERVL